VQSKRLLAIWSQIVVMAMGLGQGHAALPQSAPASAPTSAPQERAAVVTPEVIARKSADLVQKIKTSQEVETAQTALQLGVDLALLQKRTALLKELQRALDWWSGNLEREAALKREQTALAEKLATLKERGVTESPPYSLAFYEDLLSQQQFFAQRQEGYAVSNSLFGEHLNTLQEERVKAGKQWRLVQDKLAAATLPQEKQKLQFEAQIARLETELAETRYQATAIYGKIFKILEEMARQQAGVYQELAAWVQQHLQIQDSDLEKPLDLLGRKLGKLEDKSAGLQRVLWQQSKLWEQAVDKAGAAPAGDPVQAEVAQEKQNWQHTHQSRLRSVMDHIPILRVKRTLWKKRLAVLKGEVTQEQLVQWQEDLDNKREFAKKLLTSLGEQNVSLQGQLAVLEKRLAEPTLDSRIGDILTSQKAAYMLLIQEQNALIQTLADADQLASRFSHEIEARTTQDHWRNLGARLKVTWQGVRDYEIWVIDTQAVTVGKFLGALAFLILGFLLTRIILHFLIFPFLEKTLWRQTKADIIKRTVIYLAYSVVFLIALGKLKIPLQSFATLGGGIAIGLGFAAQTIIKNFISGFIILGEKPINIGDLVEVGDIVGSVQDIGSRSTLIRTGENKDILVPNSYFLEHTITNWTRRDRKIRGQVTVGVAYGSPVAQVKELLLQAAAECPQILKAPKPFVLFNDFGDNALVFDIYFGIEIAGVMARRVIQSDLRFKIDALFRTAGIVIAFPQRDVHLDAPGPLEVRLVDKES